MTLLEREFYLDPGSGVFLNVTYGYPEGLSPDWVRECQQHPAPGKFSRSSSPMMREYQLNPYPDFLDIAPAELAGIISGYFQGLFRCGEVFLTPSCSLAFAIAAQALIRAPHDEFIVLDRSYDSWPALLRNAGAKVVYARRAAGGLPDLESISAACTQRTRAIVIVSPDNPLGAVCPQDVLEQLISLCRSRDITLLIDHCLAELNPWRRQIPLLPHLPGSRRLSWIALGDTGKILGLRGTKFGALACSDGWRERLESASSAYFFQYGQYDLYLVAVVLSDPRFPPYRLGFSNQIAGHHLYLQRSVWPPLTVQPMDAGPFCLVDAAGLGLDDVSFASLLRNRYQVLVVPVSWFPAGQQAPETRVRVSLARPGKVIEQLAAALNEAAATAGGLAP